MDDLIPFIIAVVWVVMTLLGKFAQKRRGQQGGEESQEPREASVGPTTFEQVLKEMMGGQQELAPRQPPPPPLPPALPTPSEHRKTPSEHRWTPSEHQRDPYEIHGTPSEHRRAAHEIMPGPGERRWTASEHRPTPSEHRPGELVVSSLPRPAASASVRRRRSRLGRQLRSDLRGGQGLARAMILKEILGPPVALKPSGEDHG